MPLMVSTSKHRVRRAAQEERRASHQGRIIFITREVEDHVVKPARVPVETRLISAGCMGGSNGGTKERSDASPAIGRTCEELAEMCDCKIGSVQTFFAYSGSRTTAEDE